MSRYLRPLLVKVVQTGYRGGRGLGHGVIGRTDDAQAAQCAEGVGTMRFVPGRVGHAAFVRLACVPSALGFG
jgi:hypothetical protein